MSIVVIGTFWHFAYALSGRSTLIGAFAPVNESVWEHLKILMFPAIISAVAEYLIYGRKHNDFIAAKCIGIIIGLIFIVTSFYTYLGILGQHYIAADIAIFVLSCALTAYTSSKLMNSTYFALDQNDTVICLCIITAIIILFIHFSFSPPQIELFRDPITEDFGIIDIHI